MTVEPCAFTEDAEFVRPQVGPNIAKASHALRQDRFRQVALIGLASESVHKFDGETVSFSIIFQFQMLPKRTPLQAGATALLPSRFSPRVVSNLSDRSCSGPLP